MKQIFTIVFLFFLCMSASQSQVLLAQWTFPTGNPGDSIADGGIAANLNKAIHTEGGTSAIDFSKNGFTTKAAQATEWNDGADLKCWIVEITTTNYHHLTISSKQQSGGNNPGPRDWKVQYRPAVASFWTDVPNTTLEVQNDWTTGVLDSIELPEECKNQSSLFIRWVMTSNTNSSGDPVAATGINKIDDIIFTGKLINTAIPDTGNIHLVTLYPNPCNTRFSIKSDSEISRLSIIDARGRVVMTSSLQGKEVSLDVTDLPSGVYWVRISTLHSKQPITRKLLVQ
ncbi:MAG: T9SS type A sorting domain-containing protein [Bacteroidales bacterium]|nr:T9SS type A sorting domain-containing protein [Deltaproteobacteria bacterium]MBL7137554.1 T9SS type A sorting domain-containing protein [Bacteroidales bacterium]